MKPKRGILYPKFTRRFTKRHDKVGRVENYLKHVGNYKSKRIFERAAEENEFKSGEGGFLNGNRAVVVSAGMTGGLFHAENFSPAQPVESFLQ